MTKVEFIRSLIGTDAVLLNITPGQKAPVQKNWSKLTVAETNRPEYLARLEKANIGVSLGAPSNNLCSIDVDDDTAAEEFLLENPQLEQTLQSKGRRGRNFWVRIEGDYPDHVIKLTRSAEGKATPWGEWRATGGQTVISGKHPLGGDYKILIEKPPITIPFDAIKWPEDLKLPWRLSEQELLEADYGRAFSIGKRGGLTLNEVFIVAKFAREHFILFEPDERRFYSYDADRGLWVVQSEDALKQQFAADLKTFLDEQGQSACHHVRTNPFLERLVDLLRGFVEKRGAFETNSGVVHLKQSMLHLKDCPAVDKKFSPEYYSRNQCPIELDSAAQCPRFMGDLLVPVLSAEDISLLQRYAGALLLKGNIAQKIMFMTGAAGSGKSTLMEIIENVIGRENVTELRTDQIQERFEISRFIGKQVITGKDVPADFMLRKGASLLKKLVGHDAITAEVKNSSKAFDIRGMFDVVVTCNSRLRVRLDGDSEAWRRRLLVIEFKKRPSEIIVPRFGEVLLREEGSGILNWMIEGALLHLAELREGVPFRLCKEQQRRIDDLLAESDSVREFVKNCVHRKDGATVTTADMYSSYILYCEMSAWVPVPRNAFDRQSPEVIKEIFEITQSHDLMGPMGASARGYRTLCCEYVS